MINLEKIKQEKCQPPPSPFFKKTCPYITLPTPFLIFQIPPFPHSRGGIWNLHPPPPPLEKKGGRGPNYRRLYNFEALRFNAC